MDSNGLRGRALSVKGKYPGKNWARRFIRRHPTLKLAKPSGLDPKRANNFNEPTIKHYFQLRTDLEIEYDGIPPQHQWNVDEKGLQLGGGRKNSGRKFIFTRRHKDRYRIRSDNLELVTVIECVSAAGVVMPPTFILKDGPKPDIRDLPEGSISRQVYSWYCQYIYFYRCFIYQCCFFSQWVDRPRAVRSMVYSGLYRVCNVASCL